MDTPSDTLLLQLLDKFARAEVCWFSSVRPGGRFGCRAHLAPIWHVWHEGCAFVVTRADSVRCQNIRHHPQVSLALPDPLDVLVIEGSARLAPELRAAVRPAFLAKYDWDIAADAEYDTVIQVRPTKVMAWGSHGDGRWRLDGAGQGGDHA